MVSGGYDHRLLQWDFVRSKCFCNIDVAGVSCFVGVVATTVEATIIQFLVCLIRMSLDLYILFWLYWWCCYNNIKHIRFHEELQPPSSPFKTLTINTLNNNHSYHHHLTTTTTHKNNLVNLYNNHHPQQQPLPLTTTTLNNNHHY